MKLSDIISTDDKILLLSDASSNSSELSVENLKKFGASMSFEKVEEFNLGIENKGF